MISYELLDFDFGLPGFDLFFAVKSLLFSLKRFVIDEDPVLRPGCEPTMFREMFVDPAFEVITSGPDIVTIQRFRVENVDETH